MGVCTNEDSPDLIFCSAQRSDRHHSLKLSEGFTRLVPSIVVVVGYGLSFYLLSITLKVMPIGIAYALWSGIGITLIIIAGKIIWNESLE